MPCMMCLLAKAVVSLSGPRRRAAPWGSTRLIRLPPWRTWTRQLWLFPPQRDKIRGGIGGLRDAELALVRSQSRSDLRWQIGARYFEESGDSALVAGVSVPLFSKSRNQGQIRAAQAARNEVSLRRDSALLMLRARLYEAYQLHVQAVGAATTMQKQVIPDLERALELTRDAYEQGRYSYSRVAIRPTGLARKPAQPCRCGYLSATQPGPNRTTDRRVVGCCSR